MTTITASRSRGALWLGLLVLALGGCRGLRASTVPLGGTHEEEAAVTKASAPEVAKVVEPAAAEPLAKSADVVETPASPASDDAAPAKPAAPGAFQLKPYVDHQTWTRFFDLEFTLRVGPGGGVEMKMVSHQEARFEVLGVSGGSIDRLAIEYSVYTSKMTVMGNTHDEPEELAGKRFVISYAQGKPEVRDASGGKPPKKQLDSVKDDAREPLEIEKALKELSQLTAKGKGDFSTAGAVSLAGGEDEDTKVTHARASLKSISTGGNAERLALLDVSYTLTNAIDDDTTIEVDVTGPLTVLDAPARYQTSTLQGPMEIRSSQPGGTQGRGTIKVTTTYKY